MEFPKFDMTKMFDCTQAIAQMEQGTQAAITYMPEAVRDSLHSVHQAQFNLIRTTNEAIREFAKLAESAGTQVQQEIARTVQKATKVTA